MPPKVLADKIRKELEGHVRPGDHLPAVSTIVKRVGFYNRTRDPQDEHWCMGTLNDYPIPGEALNAVLNVMKYRTAREENFTIREAKWVARLAGLPKFDGTHNMRRLRRLAAFSSAYAGMEAFCDAAEYIECDTSGLDLLIMGIPRAGIPMKLRVEYPDEAMSGKWLVPDEAMSARLVYLFHDDLEEWEREPDWPPTEGWELRFDSELDGNDWRLRQINMIWDNFKKEAQNER